MDYSWRLGACSIETILFKGTNCHSLSCTACSLPVITFQGNCGMSSSQYVTLSQWYIATLQYCTLNILVRNLYHRRIRIFGAQRIFGTACLQTMTLTLGSIKNTSETKLAENCFFISYDCYAQSSMKIIDLWASIKLMIQLYQLSTLLMIAKDGTL